MHSLAPAALKADRDGRLAWEPDGPGLRSAEDVPEAPPPAASALERLAQMRAIAAGFAGRLTDARVESTGEAQSLRLLPEAPLPPRAPRPRRAATGPCSPSSSGPTPNSSSSSKSRDAPGPALAVWAGPDESRPSAGDLQGPEVWKVDKVDPGPRPSAPTSRWNSPRPRQSPEIAVDLSLFSEIVCKDVTQSPLISPLIPDKT